MANQELLSIKQRFGIIGNSTPLIHAITVASQVAPTEMSVLITGESGSGKESFSKIIHHLSKRKHGQFIAVNCGAIPEGTIDSELFGHEKGAFTGALEARKGYFEVTDGGTIFLDEIGEMPLSTQARLLRVLENGEYIRVGSSKTQKTDVRVIAATNVKLDDAVANGKFREDLYYRLNTVPIFVPPLRERGNDIDLLFRKFATDFAETYHVKPIHLDDEGKRMLLSYPFPGNIRQLKNLVEQISALELDRFIPSDKFRTYLPKPKRQLPALFGNAGGDANYIERDLLYKVLFDMKKDVNELKKLVFESLQSDNFNGSQVINDHKDLFNSMDEVSESHVNSNDSPRLLSGDTPLEYEPVPSSPIHPTTDFNSSNFNKVEDITHEIEEENLSIEAKEKELIIKALKKNNNKRKYAAQNLGISERTLYRKLKQYDLED
ncbi:MAG: sigma-54 interaction domain-containing protein [Cyclobacteriaceae bacterium]